MWLPDTGAAALILTYDDGAGHQAAATVTFFQATSTSATSQQLAFTGSPQVTGCLAALVDAQASRYAWLGSPGVPTSAPGTVPVTLHDPGDAELLSLSGNDNGSSQSALWAFTHEYVGRYEAAAQVTWCTCNALPPAGLQHLVDVVGTHLASLAAKFP